MHWIEARLRTIFSRKELTDKWKERGISEGIEFAILTDEISLGTFGKTTCEHKEYKHLKANHNLRDNMTSIELILTMLGETATKQIAPSIVEWYKQKVLPGVRNHERVAFVGYLEEKPVISAVVRKGADAKFCHLRIDHHLQNAHLEELFFAIMALEIRDLAKTIHFTLPESLWQSKAKFFQSFGLAATV